MNDKYFSFIKLALCAFLMLSLSPAVSYPAAGGDLLHYYNLAVKNDPQFRGVEFESLAARETLRQAYAGLLPKIYGEVSYGLTYQDVTNSENTVYAAGSTDYDTQTYSAYFILPIFRYSSFVAVSQAKSVQGRSDLELEKARQDLALRVAQAYMDVLLSRDKLAAVKAEEAAIERNHERAKERSAKGMAPITDRYDTEARLAAIRAQRVESENILKDSLQALAEICGEPAVDVKSLKDEIPLVQPFPENIEYWTEAGTRQNLEVLIQKMKAEIAEKEVSRQRAAHFPTLDFQFDYIYKDTKGSLFGGGSTTANYDLVGKLNIPLYEGGMVASKTREASNLHQSALQGVTRQTRAAERRVRDMYNGIISAVTRVKAMEKSIEAQKLVLQAKEEGFKAGLYINLAVLDAMQDLYKYKKEYSQARNDYILNSFRLKHAVGTLKLEELNLVNAWLQN